ncbi:rhamnogalacturonyl hydrolase YesR [Dysgonomonadaceae bacterium PH5-43]|nr:rhamnogalacturonyl hydrolase YesR [Dysgonomonadaceae bacterium PH5-43]
MRKTIYLCFALLSVCFFSLQGVAQTSIVLANSSTNYDRTDEMVEVALEPTVYESLSTLALFDEDNNPVVYQKLPYDNKIIFQATLSKGATKTYTLKTGTPATATEVKTYAAVMKPNSRGDIAWENDRAAYRMYSRTLLNSEPNSANGVDLWVKKVSTPIVEKMYTYADYHSEQVEGVDAYSVGGKTLGAGGVVALIDGKLWLHDPYDECEIIANGPLRSEFILKYNKVEIAGDYYTKTVRITTNANGLLNKAVVKFEGRIKPMKIAAGIFLHTNTKGEQYTSEANIMGYSENKSEGNVTSTGARFFEGVYMPGTTAITTINNQSIISSDYAVGSEFTYYFGGGWNIFPGDCSTNQDWFDALKKFKYTISNPLLPVDYTKLPSKKEVLNEGIRANGYWIGKNATSPGNKLWARSVYNMANIDFYKVYPDYKYLQYANLWASTNGWTISGGPSTKDADNHTAGQTYIDLYWLDDVKDPTKIKAIKEAIDYRIANNTASDDWWWIDAMLMAMPTIVRLGVEYNDTKYYDKMYALFANIRDKLVVNASHADMWPTEYRTKYGAGPILTGFEDYEGLYDKTDHFWCRDWGFQQNVPPKKDPNASWSADVPDTSPNGKKIFWSRGNGWVIAAMARTLQYLPTTDAHRDEYIAILTEMAAALKDCQREDGFWNMNLADDQHFPGQETSGTALFTYGIAWGINNGFLDKETYYPVVAKGWNGLCRDALATSGLLSKVQNVGEGPIATSRLASNIDFGVGAFLLAASEVVKLADGEMPEPPEKPAASISSVTIQDQYKRIVVKFDQDLDKTSAVDKNNYSLNGPANLTVSKVMMSGNNGVIIYFNESIDYGKYTLVVNDVATQTGAVINGGSIVFVHTVPLSNPQTEIVITAIASQSGNPPANVMDNKLSTRWAQQGRSNQWIKFDMNEDVYVEAVDIAFFKGTVRRTFFNIESSSDDAVYTPVLSDLEGSGLTDEMERYAFDKIKARYIKIVCNSNSAAVSGAESEHWNSVTEVRIRYTKISNINNVTNTQKQISIYPNPVTDGSFTIQVADNDEVSVGIYDTKGSLLFKKTITPIDGKIDINNLNLSSGNYILAVDDNKSEIINKPFIVK